MAKKKQPTPEPVHLWLTVALLHRERVIAHHTYQVTCPPGYFPMRWGFGEHFGARHRACLTAIALGGLMKVGQLPERELPDKQGFVYPFGDFEVMVIEGEWHPTAPAAIADVLAVCEVGAEVKGMVMWRFEQAPPVLTAFSQHGGDEDWVALIPPGVETPFWMSEGTSFATHIDVYDLPEGWRVLISAH